jgi:hypothetical protein
MKRFTRLALCAVAALLSATSAFSQFDLFAGPKTLLLAKPTLVTTAGFTNVADTHGFDGVAAIIVTTRTNTSGSSGTFTITGSSNPTNGFSAITTLAQATSTAVKMTNSFVFQAGSTTNAYYLTNTFLLPGVLTWPTVATDGFALPSGYIAPAPFTNGGTFTFNSDSIVELGYNIGDAPRYLAFGVVDGGAGSNVTVSAVLIGKRSQ